MTQPNNNESLPSSSPSSSSSTAADKKKMLAWLIQEQQWTEVQQLAMQHPNIVKKQVTVQDFHGQNISSKVLPMHIACAHQAPISVIECLYTIYPESLSVPDSRYQRLPLHIAVMNSANPRMVSKLVKFYPSAASVPDVLGRLPIHYGTKDVEHDESYIRVLLKAYPDSAKVADNNGFLPIHVACRSAQSMTMIRMLARANPQSVLERTKKGNTPLMCAEKTNDAVRIEILKEVTDATMSILKEEGSNALYETYSSMVQKPEVEKEEDDDTTAAETFSTNNNGNKDKSQREKLLLPQHLATREKIKSLLLSDDIRVKLL